MINDPDRRQKRIKKFSNRAADQRLCFRYVDTYIFSPTTILFEQKLQLSWGGGGGGGGGGGLLQKFYDGGVRTKP